MSTRRLHKFFPFLEWLPLTTIHTLKHDFIAGLTGTVVALPQGVAFAIIAGFPPVYGLYSAMIIPMVAALFGSSKHLVSGPATPISIVIFTSIHQLGIVPGSVEFISLAFVLTFLTGLFQLAMGLARFGNVVNFVSHTVIMGFTAGAAFIIMTSQLKQILGVKISLDLTLLDQIIETVRSLPRLNIFSLLLALSVFLMVWGLKKISLRLPHLILALIGASLIAYFINAENQGVELLGEMPGHLPPFQWPKLNTDRISLLSSSAFALALLGLIEASAISRSIAVMSKQRLDNNQEFVGQGLSNLVGSFFGAFAGSGSFTRSALNFASGAKSPLAAVFSGLLLLLTVYFVAPLTAYLPMPAVAAVIFIVAIKLIDLKRISEIMRTSGRESAVFLITFFSALFLHLEFAIYAGVIFSLTFYLRATSRPRIVVLGIQIVNGHKKLVNIKKPGHQHQHQNLRIIRIDGSLFFGSTEHVALKLSQLSDAEHCRILLDCSSINLLDLSGAELLVSEAQRLHALGGQLYLCNLKRKSREYLMRGSFRKRIGVENIFENEWMALQKLAPTLLQ